MSDSKVGSGSKGWNPEWDRLIAERIAKMPPPCEHDFGGWRELDDGRGGEQFCQKCGYGAMAWSMRMLP